LSTQAASGGASSIAPVSAMAWAAVVNALSLNSPSSTSLWASKSQTRGADVLRRVHLEVHRTDQLRDPGGVVGGGRGGDDIAVDAPDGEPGRPDRAEVHASRHERDRLPGAGELSAEAAPDAAGPHHRDAHAR
jgi:hypothetical protein